MLKTANTAELNQTTSLDRASLPEASERSWPEFFAEAGSTFLKRSGVSSALLGGAISLNDAVLPSRVANADLRSEGQSVDVLRDAGELFAGLRTATGGGVFFFEMLGHITGLGSFTRTATAIDLGPVPGKPGYGWGLSAAHFLAGLETFVTSLKVGTGPNYLTDRGDTFNVTQTAIFPGYVNSASRATLPDIMAFEYVGITPAQQATHIPATFSNAGKPLVDSLLVGIGYGVEGTPATGFAAPNGFVNGGYARMTELNSFGANPADYISTAFDNSSIIITGNSALLNAQLGNSFSTAGTSGGEVLNLAGELVAMTVAGENTASGRVAQSTLLADPDSPARGFVSNFGDSITGVPEPNTLLPLSIMGLLFGAFHRARRAVMSKLSNAAKGD